MKPAGGKPALPPNPSKPPVKRPESDPYTAAVVAIQQIVKRKRK